VSDPTYVKEQIRANPVWDLAFVLSEIMNDRAPLGWGEYIWIAECLLAVFDMQRVAFPSPARSEER